MSSSPRTVDRVEASGAASGEVRLTLREESRPDAVLAVSGTGSAQAVPASGCSCNSGGGTSVVALLALLNLLARSRRRARAAASGGGA